MTAAGMSYLGGLMLLVLAFTFTGANILTLDYSSGDFLEMESGDISMTEYASGDFLEMESGSFTMTKCASGDDTTTMELFAFRDQEAKSILLHSRLIMTTFYCIVRLDWLPRERVKVK